MIIGGKKNKNRYFIQIGLCVVLLLSSIQLIPFENQIIDNATACSKWTQSTQDDFKSGILNNLTISTTGEVKLAQETTYKKDEFINELKIAVKNNVIIDTIMTEVRPSTFKNTSFFKIFGGKSDDNGQSVQQTSDGGYIIVGTTRSYGAGKRDIQLIKADSLGILEWNKTFGGNLDDWGNSVQQTADDGYIIAGTTESFGAGKHDGWLIKTNSFGIMEWNKTFGGSNSEGIASVQQYFGNDYILVGSTSSYGAGGYDIWLIKTDNNGDMKWNKTFGDGNSEYGTSVGVTQDGGFIITGYTNSFGAILYDTWLIKTNAAGLMSWERMFGGIYYDVAYSVQQTIDGGYILAGATGSPGPTMYDIWVVKINETGEKQWNKTYGSIYTDYCRSIQQTSDGGYIVTGNRPAFNYSKLNSDVWLIKINTTGEMEWNKTFGGNVHDSGYFVQQTFDDGYIITGLTDSYGSGNNDIILIKTDKYGNCNSTGCFKSINLLKEFNTSSINTFIYNASIPDGSEIKVQFSRDNLNWYNSTDTIEGWDYLINGGDSINLLNLNWNGSKFFYKVNFSTDNINIPALQNINITYNRFFSNGILRSQPFDTGEIGSWKTLNWMATNYQGTNIKFQLKSANTKAGLSSTSFIGPDGTPFTYYNSSPSNIWFGHGNEIWLQYKAYFFTTNTSNTPILSNLTVIYNYLPNIPILINPINNTWTNDNRPTFSWIFNDMDSDSQGGFQWQIDDVYDFDSIEYDSNEINSSISLYKPSINISDNSWYWRVKTKDMVGDWGPYSIPWKINIDTKRPKSRLFVPWNNCFYRRMNTISGIASDPFEGSGVSKVEIIIQRLSDDHYWDGLNWISSKTWLLTSKTNNWIYDSSLVTWSSGYKYSIQSKAMDNANNVEISYESNIFTIDRQTVEFSNVRPLSMDISPSEEVEVGITIKDNISGVDASTVKYAISPNNGKSWNTWKLVNGLNNGMHINVTLNLTIPNGTSHLIKWKALDIAGNGPKESKVYRINVNIWLEEIPRPVVKLLVPMNDSICSKTSLELSWMLKNNNLLNVSYDIYLDVVNPPIIIKKTEHTTTSLFVNGLSDDETYYWTVIPKIGTNNGSCISGIWSFSVDIDIPIPHITLISPKNDSIIRSLLPTLSWDVYYEGIETITYNVYLDTDEDPKNVTWGHPSKEFTPKNELENNKTYYWKIVPITGFVIGLESEIWSFTIRSKENKSIPKFEFKLNLEPPEIELRPGDTRYIHAMVTNLGEINDKIVLSIPEQPTLGLDVQINEPKIIEIIPNGTAVFNLTIIATENAKDDEVMITVVAASSNAAGYKQIVEKRATLTVKILAEEEHGTGRSSDTIEYWILLIIIILIIIILLFLGSIMKRKQKPEQDVQLPVDTDKPPNIEANAPLLQLQVATQSTPIPSTPPQELLGPKTTVQPQVQLPPVTPPEIAEKSGITFQQKLELLEIRLMQGDISEETYLDLKDKFEQEARPYQPPPQLPPAQIPPTAPEQSPLTTQIPQPPIPEAPKTTTPEPG